MAATSSTSFEGAITPTFSRRKTVPKFLEEKLKKEYGADSDIPYKIMNKQGFMHGNKITAKGRRAEASHEHRKLKAKQEGQTRALAKL